MAYRNNSTAIGTYRTLEGTGDPGIHGDFRRAPDGWAAFDKAGATWRVTEAEAAAIIARTA